MHFSEELNLILAMVQQLRLSAAKQNLDLQNKRAEKQVIKELRTLSEHSSTSHITSVCRFTRPCVNVLVCVRDIT